jgi:hypothetical protein
LQVGGRRFYFMFSGFKISKSGVARKLPDRSGISLFLQVLKRDSRNLCFLSLNSENDIMRSSRSIKFSRNSGKTEMKESQNLKRLALSGQESSFRATPLERQETGKHEKDTQSDYPCKAGVTA